MKSFDLYVFDLDGTLVDTLGDITTAVNSALNDLEYDPLAPNQVKRLLGFGTQYMMSGAMKTDKPALLTKAEQLFKQYYREVGLQTTKPFPGIIQTLESIKDNGSKLAIATNKPTEGAYQILNGLGLTSTFGIIIAGDSLSIQKPDPEVLHHILEHFKMDVEKAVMIGDMDVDMITGKNAGTATAAVTWGYGSLPRLKATSPDFVLERVEEIFPA